MKTKALCVLLIPVVAAGGLAAWPKADGAEASLPSPSIKQAAVVALAAAATGALSAPEKKGSAEPAGPKINSIDLRTAVEQGILVAEFKGNGREKIRALLKNTTSLPVVVRVPAGQMFESGSNAVLVLRSGEAELRPGKPAEVAIQTAATRSGNTLGERPYQLSYGTLPRLEALLTHAQEHLELSTGALQTAVLVLTENLPLSSVAKFAATGSDLPTRFDTTPFRVEPSDIIHALLALRAIGVREGELALTIDPQLKIESMIDPLTRPVARSYYGIKPETEWEYWKTELLSGEPTTRHYALYGIARFYPDVALEMLPKWARETKTQAVLRLSAIQALADTERPEALPILHRLCDEFGRQTEFGKTAASAAQFLSAHLAKIAGNRTAVIFRGSTAMSKF